MFTHFLRALHNSTVLLLQPKHCQRIKAKKNKTRSIVGARSQFPLPQHRLAATVLLSPSLPPANVLVLIFGCLSIFCCILFGIFTRANVQQNILHTPQSSELTSHVLFSLYFCCCCHDLSSPVDQLCFYSTLAAAVAILSAHSYIIFGAPLDFCTFLDYIRVCIYVYV